MTIHTVETGYFKLDGGAMFGVVPKSIWHKKYPSDSDNLCNFAMRCMLIEDGNRLVLVDTGMGNKQSDKFFSYYKPFGEYTLTKSLENLGFSAKDITDVILTHLHFDHVGGAVMKHQEKYMPTFPNAVYWVDKSQWQWAVNPNPREKPSFLVENFMPILESGQLKFVDFQKDYLSDFMPNIDLWQMNGHTQGQIIPIVHCRGEKIAFMGDLIPTSVHLKQAYVAGYDTRPLLSMQEKDIFLAQAFAENYTLFFEHDYYTHLAKLTKTEQGFICEILDSI